jgi:hypothetical protein
MTEKPMPVAERHQEPAPRSRRTFLSVVDRWTTDRILVSARPERELTRSGELVESAMTGSVTPRDKLNAPANGPEDDAIDWAAVN